MNVLMVYATERQENVTVIFLTRERHVQVRSFKQFFQVRKMNVSSNLLQKLSVSYSLYPPPPTFLPVFEQVTNLVCPPPVATPLNSGRSGAFA